MSFSNDTRDKIQPGPKVRDPFHVLALAIIALQIVIAIGAFPFLPPIVPTHWNAAGQVNGYASRWVNTILFPAISIGIYLLLRFVSALSPRLSGRSGVAANAQVRATLLVAILLFMLVVQLCVTSIALGIAIDITFVLTLAVALLFIVIGNFLGKTRRNFWMGIRTPWTLSSEVVWERTHRLGGWLLVACGLLVVPTSFVPALRLWGIIVPIIAVSIFLYIYSYICYQHVTRDQGEPLSSPFNEGE
jgi:uncharacterized membrane protein